MWLSEGFLLFLDLRFMVSCCYLCGFLVNFPRNFRGFTVLSLYSDYT